MHDPFTTAETSPDCFCDKIISLTNGKCGQAPLLCNNQLKITDSLFETVKKSADPELGSTLLCSCRIGSHRFDYSAVRFIKRTKDAVTL